MGITDPGPIDPGGADETPRERVERLQRDNDAALQALARIEVGVDQSAIVGTRLAVLTEHLLGDMDDPRRLAYELAVQERFAKAIADTQRQVNRAALLRGVNGANPPGVGG